MPQRMFESDNARDSLASSVPLEDIVGWDIRNWSRALAFWEAHLPFQDTNNYCLELGCGENSSLALWLAQRGCRVLCTDRDGVSASIKKAHLRHDAASQVSYGSVDARAIPYSSEFNIVAFKSVLGGIVGRGNLEIARDVIAAIHRSLKPGGALIFAENLYSSPVHQYARTRFGAGKDGWRYFRLEEIESLLSGFSKVEITTCGFLGCFGRSEKQRDWLARLDRNVCEKLIPKRWHYIAAVVAEK